MSEYFRKSNKETTEELFDKRLIYDYYLNPTDTNLVDFSFAEKRLYGRVDRDYVPIYLHGALPVKNIPAPPGQPQLALNFVADAFAALQGQFAEKAAQGQIDTTTKYLSTLTVHKSYKSPQSFYNEYYTAYMEAFEEIIQEEGIIFVNFKQFMDKILPYLADTATEHPFTFPGFLKSKECPILATGLAIEIADIPYDNDEKKYKEFLQSNNWYFFLSACANYGFMVDRHIPYRLVADIASAPMLSYAQAYGAPNTDAVLGSAFSTAHKTYFNNFKEIMFNFYERNRLRRIRRHTYVNNASRLITHEPVTYTLDSLPQKYNDLYFLQLYCKLRFAEEESTFSPPQQERLIRQTLSLAKVNLDRALDSFEIILNKPFDYRGSLTYIINARKETEE